jgi:hypothetical protein
MLPRMSEPLTMTAEQVERLPLDQAEAVLAAWVRERRVELPEALSASTSKPLAKLAKKALYQLRSQGLAVTGATRSAAPSPAAAEAQEPSALPGVLSPIVGTGERAVLFAVPVRGGGLDVFQGIVSDEFGVVQFGSGHTNRSTYRARVRELERDGALRVLQVPLARMKEELGRAMTLNARSNTKLPDEWEAALRKVGVTPLDPDVPVPPMEADDASDVERAAALHGEPELGQWLPGEGELLSLSRVAQELRSSPLALSDAQRAEQLTQQATALARDFLTVERRALYARRLWFTAELFDATDRRDAAALARAEARRLSHGTAPSAFIERMFVKAAEQAPPPTSAAEVVSSHLGLSPPK